MKKIANEYVETVPLSTRLEKSKHIIRTFKDKVPIIMLFDSMFRIPSKKLVLSKLTSSYHLYVLLSSLGHFYIMSQNGTLLTNQLLGKIYNENVSNDGYLYLIVTTKLESP